MLKTSAARRRLHGLHAAGLAGACVRVLSPRRGRYRLRRREGFTLRRRCRCSGVAGRARVCAWRAGGCWSRALPKIALRSTPVGQSKAAAASDLRNSVQLGVRSSSARCAASLTRDVLAGCMRVAERTRVIHAAVSDLCVMCSVLNCSEPVKRASSCMRTSCGSHCAGALRLCSGRAVEPPRGGRRAPAVRVSLARPVRGPRSAPGRRTACSAPARSGGQRAQSRRAWAGKRSRMLSAWRRRGAAPEGVDGARAAHPHHHALGCALRTAADACARRRACRVSVAPAGQQRQRDEPRGACAAGAGRAHRDARCAAFALQARRRTRCPARHDLSGCVALRRPHFFWPAAPRQRQAGASPAGGAALHC